MDGCVDGCGSAWGAGHKASTRSPARRHGRRPSTEKVALNLTQLKKSGNGLRKRVEKQSVNWAGGVLVRKVTTITRRATSAECTSPLHALICRRIEPVIVAALPANCSTNSACWRSAPPDPQFASPLQAIASNALVRPWWHIGCVLQFTLLREPTLQALQLGSNHQGAPAAPKVFTQSPRRQATAMNIDCAQSSEEKQEKTMMKHIVCC
jgi:hypothetical protein